MYIYSSTYFFYVANVNPHFFYYFILFDSSTDGVRVSHWEHPKKHTLMCRKCVQASALTPSILYWTWVTSVCSFCFLRDGLCFSVFQCVSVCDAAKKPWKWELCFSLSQMFVVLWRLCALLWIKPNIPLDNRCCSSLLTPLFSHQCWKKTEWHWHAEHSLFWLEV